MLAFPAGLRIFLALEAVDMRKQFNGLWAVASEKLREDPKSGEEPMGSRNRWGQSKYS